MTDTLRDHSSGSRRIDEQRPTALEGARRPRMPGLEGFWFFVAGDLAIFTLMFVGFVVARRDDVDAFAAGSAALDPDRGGINTLLLLTSSMLVALAVVVFRQGRERLAGQLLLAGVAGGTGFSVLKIWEYIDSAAADHTIGQGGFFTWYYSITGIHLIHVVIGCLILTAFGARLLRGRPVNAYGLDSAACYWHMVDLLWLVIFPLVYLVR